LEGIVARLAAERRDGAAVAALGELLGKMEHAGSDTTAFVEADASFHLRIAEASGNGILMDLLKNVQSLSREWIRRVVESSDRQQSYLEHVPIFQAIAAGDSEAASVAMAAHMASASSRLRVTLQTSDRPREG
jgi:GntR family transcriptional repressor for pyruvate dehydrogenase complex